MELKNGYKVIYDIASNNEHVFYASTSGLFDDKCKEICRLTGGQYKLIYEKNGQFFGSASGIPTADDKPISEAFNKVFIEETEENSAAPKTKSTRRRSGSTVEPPVTEPSVEEPVTEEPVVEEPTTTPEVEE